MNKNLIRPKPLGDMAILAGFGIDITTESPHGAVMEADTERTRYAFWRQSNLLSFLSRPLNDSTSNVRKLNES